MIELKDFRASNNQLNEFNADIFNDQYNLEILDLQNNKLTSLPDNIDPFIRVDQLLLKGNENLGQFNLNYKDQDNTKSFMLSYLEILDPAEAKIMKDRIVSARIEATKAKHKYFRHNVEKVCYWCGEKDQFKSEKGRMVSAFGFTQHHIDMIMCQNCGHVEFFHRTKSLN